MKMKPKRPRLENLSFYPMTMDEALTAFMKVDPKKVDARLERDGITSGRKAYQRKAKRRKK